MLFCHDETRAALFIVGLRKLQFAILGGEIFRQLFADTLAALACQQAQIRRALLSLGPCGFDMATDRSVLGSIRVARQDLEAYLWNFPNVLMMDPVEASRRVTRRPVSVRGKRFWPQDRLLELVAGLDEIRSRQ